MSIQAAIITCDKRMEVHLGGHVAELYDAIPAMKPHIFMDPGHYGCTANHLRAWNWLTHIDSDWSLVLEDDAILVDDFDNQVRDVLAHSPSPVVSLYLGKGRPPHWQRRAATAVATDAPYIVATTMLHAVAVAIRTDLVSDMVGAAMAAATSPVAKPIDEAITEWCKSRALPVAYCNPSIVDHDVSLPSVARHAEHEAFAQDQRVAHRFGLPSKPRGGGGLAIM